MAGVGGDREGGGWRDRYHHCTIYNSRDMEALTAARQEMVGACAGQVGYVWKVELLLPADE